MIDKEKIENLLANLDEYLDEIDKLRLLPLDNYLKNKRNVYSGRYLLQIAIETCINLGNHIIARQKLGIPNEYADTFRILKNKSILSEALLKNLILMTKFRNRIVHLYWEVDDKVVHEIMQNNLKDFVEFKSQIKSYLKQLDSENEDDGTRNGRNGD